MVGAALSRDDNTFPILGYLTFYSIPDLSISADRVRKLWDDAGCPGSVPAIRGCDAFRRATSSLATSSATIGVNGIDYPIRILVREVSYDKDTVLRHLILERVDKKGKRLSYLHAGDLCYDRNSDSIVTNMVADANAGNFVPNLLAQASQLFLDYRYNHNQDTVRNFVGRNLTNLNNVAIIPGSPGKFVPRSYQIELEALGQFLVGLCLEVEGDDCRMDLLPLVDTETARRTLTNSVQGEFTSRVDTLIEEFAVYLKGERPANVHVIARLIEQSNNVRVQAAEYQKLLSVRMGFVEHQTQDLINRISALVHGDQPAEGILVELVS